MPRKYVRGNSRVTGALTVGGAATIGGALTVSGAITPALGTETADDVMIIKNAAAPTKKIRFSAAGVTAGQTRVLTAPDYNGTLATLAGTETFTGKTLTSPKVGTAICDTSGNEIIKTPATADAVNELTVTNAATGDSPLVSATGGDTNISIKLAGKGTGKIVSGSRIVDVLSATTIDNASDQLYTAAQLLGGVILRECTAGAREDTLPTAALLVAAIPGAAIGNAFEWTLRNISAVSGTVTVVAGDGGTLEGTATVAQGSSKRWLVVLTAVTVPAYTIYSLGTAVH